MRVVFLGTSAGAPTGARAMPAVAVLLGRETLLLDCGEGTQMRLREAGLSPQRIARICVSHLHGDHVLGLPGLLMSMQLGGRTAPLVMHGPPGLSEFIHSTVRMLQARIAFPLEITEHSGPETPAVTADYTLACAPLEHRVPCLGYALCERDTQGSLDVAEARRLGVPDGPLMGHLKAGETILLPDGTRVAPAQVVGPPLPGRKITYCTDTVPCEACVTLAKGADLLIHEATFASELARDAHEKGHATAAEAAAIAVRAGVRHLALTHISPRYTDASPLLAEARALFPAGILAEDLLDVEIDGT